MSRLSILSLLRCAALPALLLIGYGRGIYAQVAAGGPAEERFVRQTYLKLSLLNRASLRRELSRKGVRAPREEAPSALCWATSVPGQFEEILARPIAEVATFPAGDIIRLVETLGEGNADCR
jgi:hypothetical protein